MAPFSFTIRRAPIELSCEVGSIAEAIGILQTEDSTVRTLIATADDLNGSNGEANAAPQGDAPATVAEAPTKRRGRGAAKDKGDAAAAQAPAPEAIPGAAPPAAPAAAPDPAKVAELAAQNAAAAATGGVPDFLKRQDGGAAAPPPPAPPAPPAPPRRPAFWPAR